MFPFITNPDLDSLNFFIIGIYNMFPFISGYLWLLYLVYTSFLLILYIITMVTILKALKSPLNSPSNAAMYKFIYF